MKRTQIPVLLVVLCLLCMSSLLVPAAWADDPGDRLQRPAAVRQHSLIVDTTGEPADDEGDPDTMGGGYGVKKADDLLGGADSCGDDEDVIWMELLLQFMDLFPIVR